MILLALLGCPTIETPPDRGDAQHLDACEATVDCQFPMVCGGDGLCHYEGEPGTGTVGDECLSSAFCLAELACSSEGVCAEAGSPGTAAAGDTCEADTDCQLGLSCSDDGVCVGFGLPLWTGEVCDEDEGESRVYHEVATENDFYRWPFPNDGYVQDDGTLDLSSHPTPGVLIDALGDPAAVALEAWGQDFDGFGLNAGVTFRMSAPVAADSLDLALPSAGGTVGLVDLTEGAQQYGAFASAAYRLDPNPQLYVCQNSLVLRPAKNTALASGHTYAAYITTGVTDRQGLPLGADADLEVLLGDTRPTATRLLASYDAYAPFREWLAATGQSAADFAGVAVFTTQDVTVPLSGLRAAVDAQGAPTVLETHLCVDGEPGPYADPDDPSRACDGVSADFHQLQGLVELPRWQQGTPPFKMPQDGGAIGFTAGQADVVDADPVHFTLTVPAGDMPADGWPLVLYFHGTDGNHRSAVREGLVAGLSDVALDAGGSVGFATLTIDAVNHGPRRHPENWDPAWLALDPDAYAPDVLYFNPLNPRAARDNALQAAADAWSLLLLAESLDWAEGDSALGQAVRFDQLYYVGHSQGATTGAVAVAYAPELDGAVLSAAGGLLMASLLGKTNPVDIAGLVKLGLADPAPDRFHPLLNIVQAAGERADGVNHAPYVLRSPLSGAGLSVYQIAGQDDTYTPNDSQQALARALGVVQDDNGAESWELALRTTPISATHAGPNTGVLSVYDGTGRDPHFVLFDRDDTRRQFEQFLATGVDEGLPVVVVP